ncbi:MaoC family dehydratase N-terminal domain-containing protein [Subtercola endophyticus]|uniref:MaoC family dehydratase N-terminal domain-containing protein n=1 Tax=Subtercola endophyticus TaxID=2895559 RepID=UPI001E62F425|nr:MaoC family dehydratase N-terminal domain-containing protein [Subtercola endophyticus]UFS57994.1 MaoC family dehydratase N-terminal domain-containing protein [Subtercola endophyticus]
MPINPELQGRVYAKTPSYLVGREKIREFSRAVFSTSPLNFDVEAARAAGYADVVAPPTFAIVLQQFTLQQLLDDDDAGIELSHVVHGQQQFTSARPIVAGDELTAVQTIASVKSLGGNSMITSESVIEDAAGEHVATTTSTLVVRGDS